MFTIPKKTADRLGEGITKFKRIVAAAQKNDLNESDTVTVITDMFSELFGYDKYSEITSEYEVKGTYCDLAIKLGNKPKIFIECKPIGTKLKDIHARQAIDYGTKEGIDWVILTNADEWHVYKIIYHKKPVVTELVNEFVITELKPRHKESLELLYPISREGMTRSKTALAEVYEHRSMLNKYMLGQLILDETTVAHLRKLLKKMSPDIKIAAESIEELLRNDVLKREVIDPENTKDCRRIIKKRLGSAPAAKKETAPEDHEDQPDDLQNDFQND